MQKALIVVDMQNFFVTGKMGTPEVRAIVPNIIELIKNFEGKIYVTQDINPSCAEGTESFDIFPPIKAALPDDALYFTKKTFGCVDLVEAICEEYKSAKENMPDGEQTGEIELCGVCTDACVITNTLVLKTFLPDVKYVIDSSCCAGHTPERHLAALETMKSCRIEVREVAS